MKRNKFFQIGLAGYLLIGINSPAFSQSKATFKYLTSDELIFWTISGVVFMTSLLVLFTAIYVLYAVQYMVLDKQGRAQTEGVWGSLWKAFDKTLTNAIPLEKEQTILLNHNYDGIQELDNHLPPWWLYLFYGSAVFAVIYMLLFHVWGTFSLQAAEYENEEKTAQIEIEAYKKLFANSIDESTVKITKDKVALTKAKELFATNCKSCHGAVGEGGIGPNLTDEYWLHGSDIQAIFKTIKYGIPQKGMKAWQKDFSPADIQSLSSYVLTLQGTKPANGKEPQGAKAKQR